ncbi:hypothetical protein K1719_024697 [Acacia pycnantha]|nr:hypothetical protein K1719_024697 [Acacia pycnantha]
MPTYIRGNPKVQNRSPDCAFSIPLLSLHFNKKEVQGISERDQRFRSGNRRLFMGRGEYEEATNQRRTRASIVDFGCSVLLVTAACSCSCVNTVPHTFTHVSSTGTARAASQGEERSNWGKSINIDGVGGSFLLLHSLSFVLHHSAGFITMGTASRNATIYCATDRLLLIGTSDGCIKAWNVDAKRVVRDLNTTKTFWT